MRTTRTPRKLECDGGSPVSAKSSTRKCSRLGGACVSDTSTSWSRSSLAGCRSRCRRAVDDYAGCIVAPCVPEKKKKIKKKKNSLRAESSSARWLWFVGWTSLAGLRWMGAWPRPLPRRRVSHRKANGKRTRVKEERKEGRKEERWKKERPLFPRRRCLRRRIVLATGYAPSRTRKRRSFDASPFGRDWNGGRGGTIFASSDAFSAGPKRVLF